MIPLEIRANRVGTCRLITFEFGNRFAYQVQITEIIDERIVSYSFSMRLCR